MITAASLTNVDTADAKALAAGTAGSVSGGGVSLRTLSVSYEPELQAVRKHQSSGEWENYAYVRRLVLTLNGMIAGASASDYITQRIAFVKSFMPDEGVQTERNHTTLALTFSDGTAVTDGCIFESFEAPMTVDDAPIAAEYTLVLINRSGYFHTSGGVVVKL